MENSKYQESPFAPFLKKIEDAVATFKDLSLEERHLVLLRLIEGNDISYPDFSKLYVDVLQRERKSEIADTSTLSLWLGTFLRDRSPDTAHMRRFLWEKGYHRGSRFGDRLDEEFVSKK